MTGIRKAPVAATRRAEEIGVSLQSRFAALGQEGAGGQQGPVL